MMYSIEALKIIKKWEGYHERLADGRARAYLCPAGVPTIGYGSTFYENGQRVKLGEIISHDRAIELLEFEMKKCVDAVKINVIVQLSQQQIDALTSFVYNLGEGNFRSSTLLKELNKKNYLEAADQLLRWNKATVNGKLVPLAGLTKRRQEERELFLTGSHEMPIYFETIKKGDRGSAVATLQKMLVALSYFPKNEVIDGIFGQNTESKVMLFQKMNALVVDAVVGKKTWAKLHEKLGAIDDNPETVDGWDGLNGDYIVIRKTGRQHASGLVLLSVDFFEAGKKYGSVVAYAGQPHAQSFLKGIESEAGSMQPPPELKRGYKVHDIRWAGARDDWSKELSSALGPWLVWIEEKDKNDSRRREICFHIDWNKSYAVGSAGCVVFETHEMGRKFLELIRKADPKHCFVDWGHGYVVKGL